MSDKENTSPESIVSGELDENGFLKNNPPLENAENVAPEVEPPKRRGRPPLNKDKVNAREKIEAGTSATSPKPTKRKTTIGGEAIALMGKQLVGLHLMAYQLTGLPECQITDGEGAALAQGIALVANEYDLSLDGKTGAALQLILTLGMVYGPRVLSVNAKMKASKNAAVVPG